METLPDGTKTSLWLDQAKEPFFGCASVVQRGIRSVELKQEKLESVWQQLRGFAPKTGWWPVLLGSPDDSIYVQHQYFLESGEEPRFVADIMAEAVQIDPAEWFRKRESRWQKYCASDARLQEDFRKLMDPANSSPAVAPNRPDRILEEAFVRDRTSGGTGVLLLVPCRNCWEIPVLLNLGGWNNFPLPAEQAAVWRYWYERWGATIIGVAESTICGAASRRPIDLDGASELAWQQFYYDSEAMTADGAFLSASIPDLASLRMKYSTWTFWWT